MSRIDKEEREAEYQFMLAISMMLGVDRETFDKLFEENADFDPPTLEMNRIVQLQRLIMVANVDLEVTSEEVDFLRQAGFKLGLNPDAVDQVIIEMRKHEAGNIPPDKLINIFKTYHN